MVFLPKTNLMMILAGNSDSVPAHEVKHNGVTFSFPNKPLFTQYKNLVAVVIDVVMQADKMLVTKKVNFPEIELHGIKISNNEFMEDRIPVYAYESLTLGKTMRIISSDIEGSTIPSKREPASVVPAALDTLELASGGSDRGSLVFLLPEEWFLIQRIGIGDSVTKILEKNVNIPMKEFTKNGIIKYFKKHRVFNENLERLYSLYKSIDSFEKENSKIEDLETPNLELSDLELEEKISSAVDAYMKGDHEITDSLKKNVTMNGTIERIGTFSRKQGIVLNIVNRSELGTVKSIDYTFKLVNSSGKEVYLGDNSLDEIMAGPGKVIKKPIAEFPGFDGINADRIEIKITGIKWSNNVTTVIEVKKNGENGENDVKEKAKPIEKAKPEVKIEPPEIEKDSEEKDIQE